MAKEHSNDNKAFPWKLTTIFVGILMLVLGSVSGSYVHQFSEHRDLVGHPVMIERVSKYNEKMDRILTELDEISKDVQKVDLKITALHGNPFDVRP